MVRMNKFNQKHDLPIFQIHLRATVTYVIPPFLVEFISFKTYVPL